MNNNTCKRVAPTPLFGVDQMEMLRMFLYHLADIGVDNWTKEVLDKAAFDQAVQLTEDYLCTAEGEPAEQNIQWLRSRGWRVNIVRVGKTHWYGELFVWGPYHITFSWTGQESVGV